MEISLCLAFSTMVATASLSLVTHSWQAARELRKVEQQATDLAAIRSTLARTVEQADRVALFSNAGDARAMNTQACVLTGTCLGLEFAGGTRSTIEYREGERRLWYRNADGTEWVITPAVDAGLFSFEHGVLRLAFTQRGVPWEIWAAAN